MNHVIRRSVVAVLAACLAPIALADDPLVRLAIAALLVPAALALDAWYDKPVRTLLARRFSQAKPAAMPAP